MRIGAATELRMGPSVASLRREQCHPGNDAET